MRQRKRPEELYRYVSPDWTEPVTLQSSTGWSYGQVQVGLQRLLDDGIVEEEARGGRVRRVEGKGPAKRRIEGYPATGFPEVNRIDGVLCPVMQFDFGPDVLQYLERQHEPATTLQISWRVFVPLVWLRPVLTGLLDQGEILELEEDLWIAM
jgi:hypothetical protein